MRGIATEHNWNPGMQLPRSYLVWCTSTGWALYGQVTSGPISARQADSPIQKDMITLLAG